MGRQRMAQEVSRIEAHRGLVGSRVAREQTKIVRDGERDDPDATEGCDVETWFEEEDGRDRRKDEWTDDDAVEVDQEDPMCRASERQRSRR